MDNENSNSTTSSIIGVFQRNADNTEPPKQAKPRVAGAIMTAAAIVVVLAGIKAASGLLGPILLALFIAIVLLIPLRFLQQHHCPQYLSYILVIGGSVVLFVVLTYFISTSLNEFIGKIPAYKDKFTEKFVAIEKHFQTFNDWIGNDKTNKSGTGGDRIGEVSSQTKTEIAEKTETADKPKEDSVENTAEKTAEKIVAEKPETGQDEAKEEDGSKKSASIFPLHSALNEEELPTQTPEQIEQWVRNVQDEKQPSRIALDPQSVTAWVTNVFLQIRHLVEGGFLVLIFSIFFLFEASQFSAKVDKAFGKDGAINNSHLHQIANDIRHYLVLKTIVNCASGGAAMFVYFIFGIPAWFFWGIMAFFLYYIPNIGGTLAAVIPGILIFVNYDLPGVFLYGICLVVIECTIAYGFEPRFLGHGLGLSTVVILLTLVFWGWILGPIGLFLAAPLTVMLKIILAAFPETKWIAVMLDDNKLGKSIR
jgi:predicted PurR-regulated permease PerM